jgi:hypothetical protein
VVVGVHLVEHIRNARLVTVDGSISSPWLAC